MEVAEAYSLIARAIDVGKAATGYLIVGEIRGNAEELTAKVLAKLFPDEAEKAISGAHPDVVRLEPQGKSRTIKAQRAKDDEGPGMRDGLIEQMDVTAYSGGWKVGVIVGADRMQPVAANAFLKSLEEPTPKTMYLLLTDQPDAILPTIISRTQRIDLPLSSGTLAGTPEFDRIAAALTHKDVAALTKILAELKDAADDADVAIVRKQFYRTLQSLVRQYLVDQSIPRYQALGNLEAVEVAYHQSERALNEEAVLSFMLDRIVLPKTP